VGWRFFAFHSGKAVIPELAAGAAASAAFLAWAVRGPSSPFFGPSVFRGPANRKALAFTFDDGPTDSTPDLLEVLDTFRIPATFFQCGAHAELRPGIAKQVSAAGHEIGNHTHTHPPLWMRSRREIHSEITQAQRTLTAVHGAAPALFRPTYGVRWFGLSAALRDHHLLSVLWTTIGLDWTLQASAIARRLARGAHNGAIFCLHDGRDVQLKPNIRPTIEAVRAIAPVLRDTGYEFLTVSQLLCKTN
jgi:peptidoglycan/xylan/chitin deacetylase (PgdA/CDA1 family)